MDPISIVSSIITVIKAMVDAKDGIAENHAGKL